MKTAKRLRQGIAAAKAGNKEEAEQILREVVAREPQNERAWLWLSAVVEGVDEQRACLQRVLEINPTNAFARSGLRFINHLRPGYEYLAARAPWIAGMDDDRTAIADLPPRRCPRCGMLNPGWAYLCNRCMAPLQPVDVAELMREKMREERSSSLVRPWASAAVLDATRAFAPEVTLASPPRAILTIVLGSIALNLMRLVGGLGLVSLTTTRLSFRLLDRLMVTFLGDQLGLLIGGLVAWILLAAVSQAIARSHGGLGSPRVHYYLVAVAVSAWMPIAGVTGLLWWATVSFFPRVPPALAVALACGLLFFYAVTLMTQAVYTAHNLQSSRAMMSIGLILMACTVVYAGLTVLGPPALRPALLQIAQAILLPISP